MSARAGQRPKQPNPGPRRSPYVTPEVQGILERALRFRKWNADADKLRNLVEESRARSAITTKPKAGS